MVKKRNYKLKCLVWSAFLGVTSRWRLQPVRTSWYKIRLVFQKLNDMDVQNYFPSKRSSWMATTTGVCFQKLREWLGQQVHQVQMCASLVPEQLNKLINHIPLTDSAVSKTIFAHKILDFTKCNNLLLRQDVTMTTQPNNDEGVEKAY